MGMSSTSINAWVTASHFFENPDAVAVFLAGGAPAAGTAADGSPLLIKGPKLAKRICAIDIGGIIGSFAHSSSFLAFAGSHCPGVTHLQAACSAEVLSVVGALSQFAAAGASFDLACGKRISDSVQHLGERPYRRLVEDTAYVTV